MQAWKATVCLRGKRTGSLEITWSRPLARRTKKGASCYRKIGKRGGRRTDRPESAIICYSFFRFLNSDEWFKIWLLILCRTVEWAPRDAGFCHWSRHRALNRTGDSFPGRSWMKPALETDVWMPDSRTGHFQLFYFAAFIAVLGIGGNIAIRHLWTSLVSTANLF